MFRNSLIKTQSLVKKSKFQPKSKKKKKKDRKRKKEKKNVWSSAVANKKNTFFSRDETICNLSPFTRDQYARFPSPLLLFFYFSPSWDASRYLDCRIGSTNLLPINRVSEWSGSPLIAADTRYFCAIPNRFSSVVIVCMCPRHSGRPSIPFQFVHPTLA